MVLKTRDYSSEKDYKHYDTARLREEYVVEDVFGVDDIHLTYSYIDRIIFGGVIPVNEEVVLGSAPELRAEHFLDRREMELDMMSNTGKPYTSEEVLRKSSLLLWIRILQLPSTLLLLLLIRNIQPSSFHLKKLIIDTLVIRNTATKEP